MASPITPEMCVNTGRLMTEWFEYAEKTDEQIIQEALEAHGIEEMPEGGLFHAKTYDERTLSRQVVQYVNSHKHRKWKNNMTKQEVSMRLNEASKMVNPDNQKFLPDDVRDRTGLELNPLWLMETLVRSGALSPKEQVTALKELAGYTHSKAPSISHNTNVNGSPEDWLEELSREEYKEIEVPQPKQPRERGAGPRFEKERAKRTRESAAIADFGSEQRAELENLIEDADFEEIDDFD